MTINDSVLQSSEKLVFALRELYLSYGFTPYRMSKFEEYDLYAKNKDFLVSDNVITFTDIGGKLMALKPDVTLSLIKNTADEKDKTTCVFYNENVYRVSKSTGSYKEIMQSGVECFGRVEDGDICRVLSLAARSLRLISPASVLVLSDIGVLSDIVARLALSKEKESALYSAIGEKNKKEIAALTAACDGEAKDLLFTLLDCSGPLLPSLEKVRTLLGEKVDFGNFFSVAKALLEKEGPDRLQLDFSLVADINYYNGIIFKGFLQNIPTEVLSGGQYDRLMRKLGRRSFAIGFAVDTDLLDYYGCPEEKGAEDGYINVALPKGRLGEKIYGIFEKAGYPCDGILEPSRKLVFENPEKRVRYFWVKPSDVAIYVERGAADIGVAGKDILDEYEPDVYELLDLKKGKCRMAVAAPEGYRDDPQKPLIVATKFANIAKKYYLSLGRDIDIIHLNGSIEIAPILGLSDVIVDIVETGNTLRENHLAVTAEIEKISARLIANKAAYKFKREGVDALLSALARETEEEE